MTRVIRESAARLPTKHGVFQVIAYKDTVTEAEHVVLANLPASDDSVLVRVHSECLTGDAFGSLKCDCGPQLDASLALIAEAGGALVYLTGQEGRGIGIAAKIAAYALQDAGRDTVDANTDLGLPVDDREYGAAAAILSDLGLHQIKLLTNNPLKVTGLVDAGIKVAQRVGLHVGKNPENDFYRRTKNERMGHYAEGEGQ